jgi:sulfate adenylyltransferase subunit 1
MRFPVQYVIRTSDVPGYRGYAGRVASGVVHEGDEVVVLPTGTRTTITAIDTPDGHLAEASEGRSVTLLFEDELDVGRGDLVAAAAAPPPVTTDVTATLCWLGDQPLHQGARLLVKHGTRIVTGIVDQLCARFDEQRLRLVGTPRELALNEIGTVRIRTSNPIPVDDYDRSRSTGCFVVIDPTDGATLAAGLVGTPLPLGSAGAPRH